MAVGLPRQFQIFANSYGMFLLRGKDRICELEETLLPSGPQSGCNQTTLFTRQALQYSTGADKPSATCVFDPELQPDKGAIAITTNTASMKYVLVIASAIRYSSRPRPGDRRPPLIPVGERQAATALGRRTRFNRERLSLPPAPESPAHVLRKSAVETCSLQVLRAQVSSKSG